MNNKIIFALVLLALAVSNLALAQQKPHSHNLETNRFLGEYPERRHSIYNEPNVPINPPLFQSFNADITTLNAIIPDFQVNENAGPNEAIQKRTSITTDGNGNFVITWVDRRNGDEDIYAQRHSSDGSAIGINFKVNDDVGSDDQDHPSISSDDIGNFVVTWRIGHTRDADIYARRFSSDGSALGTTFKVNDTQGSAFQYSHSIFSDNSGSFVIMWDDNRNGDTDIYAQRYSNDGNVLGSNFKVNDTQGSASLWSTSPSISTDGTGNFVIVWHNFLNGDYDIYAQRYASDGSAIGTNFKINDDSGSTNQMFPSISTNNSSSFVITWTDKRNGDTDIYGQVYSSDGSALGTNFEINDDQQGARQKRPYICTDSSGNFVIMWVDERNGDPDIYAQRYSSDGAVLGTNFKIDFDFENVLDWMGYAFYISCTADNRGNFVMTWADQRNGDADIYAQRYSSDGSMSGPDFRVNDDIKSKGQKVPCISIDNTGDFVVAWCNWYTGGSDLYVQRYSSDGSALGTNFKVNENQGSVLRPHIGGPLPPSISTDGSDNFVITWTDMGNNGWIDVYAQRYSSVGSVLGTNFKVNDDQESSGHSPSISTDSSGNFVITWQDRRNGESGIYTQRYSRDGSALGTNFKVNDDQGSANIFSPSISTDGSGNFVIAWCDERNGDYDIYAQRYSRDGTAVGPNFRVNDDQKSAYQWPPSVSTDGSGNFVIAWEDGRNGDADIYAQRFSSDGGAVGTNFKVNDDQENTPQRSPSISTDDYGNFVIAWCDECNGDYDVYAQRYLSDGVAVGENFRVTNTGDKNQSSPDVKLWNGLIYTTWTDNRTGGTGYDIWANVLDWGNPTRISDKERSLPSAFMLSQNYPNPFNPTTAIQYQLPKGGMVTLEVYNFIGQRVKRLVYQNQTAGIHQQLWDGRNDDGEMMPTGVYFYQLRSDNFSATKKMLLMQ
jgi:hypothetical protein